MWIWKDKLLMFHFTHLEHFSCTFHISQCSTETSAEQLLWSHHDIKFPSLSSCLLICLQIVMWNSTIFNLLPQLVFIPGSQLHTETTHYTYIVQHTLSNPMTCLSWIPILLHIHIYISRLDIVETTTQLIKNELCYIPYKNRYILELCFCFLQ